MTSPLQSAARFTELERCRSKLKDVGQLADQLNRTRILEPVSRFEAYRSRFFSWDDQLDSTQVQESLHCILGWRQPPASLTEENLLELHSVMAPESAPGHWRQENGPLLFNHHKTLAPELVKRALHRFVSWVGSEGFGEIHPVEQSTLCQLRLLEICPFSKLNHPASIIFSYYFLVAADYLLPTFRKAEARRYRTAILEGLQFSTSSLVDLHLKACLRSYAKLENFPP